MSRLVARFDELGFRGASPKVHSVSLDVERGEVIAVLGATGCGKTLLLKALGGVGRESVNWRGQATFENASLLPGVGWPATIRDAYVGQNPHENIVFPDVYSEVVFSLECAEVNWSSHRKRVREVAKCFGLAEYLDYETHALSPGQQKRVSLAEAIVRGVDLLLLDEPEGYLDDAGIEGLSEAIRRVVATRRPPAVIIATHDLAFAESLAARFAVVRASDVEAVDTIASSSRDLETAKPLSLDFLAYGPPSSDTDLGWRDLRFRYNSSTSLSWLDGTIRSGEALEIIEPNGSGKSTLLKLLTGAWRKPAAGEVLFNDKSVFDSVPNWPRDIFLLLQSPTVHLVGDSLRYEMELMNRVNSLERQEKVRLEVAMQELRVPLGRPLAKLSFGERRFASMLVGLLTQGFFLLDECTVGLDAGLRSVLARFLRSRLSMGVGVIVTYARQGSALQLASTASCFSEKSA